MKSKEALICKNCDEVVTPTFSHCPGCGMKNTRDNMIPVEIYFKHFATDEVKHG